MFESLESLQMDRASGTLKPLTVSQEGLLDVLKGIRTAIANWYRRGIGFDTKALDRAVVDSIKSDYEYTALLPYATIQGLFEDADTAVAGIISMTDFLKSVYQDAGHIPTMPTEVNRVLEKAVNLVHSRFGSVRFVQSRGRFEIGSLAWSQSTGDKLTFKSGIAHDLEWTPGNYVNARKYWVGILGTLIECSNTLERIEIAVRRRNDDYNGVNDPTITEEERDRRMASYREVYNGIPRVFYLFWKCLEKNIFSRTMTIWANTIRTLNHTNVNLNRVSDEKMTTTFKPF